MVQIYRPENQSAVLITFIIKQKKTLLMVFPAIRLNSILVFFLDANTVLSSF